MHQQNRTARPQRWHREERCLRDGETFHRFSTVFRLFFDCFLSTFDCFPTIFRLILAVLLTQLAVYARIWVGLADGTISVIEVDEMREGMREGMREVDEMRGIASFKAHNGRVSSMLLVPGNAPAEDGRSSAVGGEATVWSCSRSSVRFQARNQAIL